MSVMQRHPDYVDNRTIWEANRDAFNGQKSIKEAGTTYLPQLGYHREGGDEGTSAYLVYLQNAVWFDGVYRITTASTGLVFRKNPFITGDDIDIYLEDFTVDNKSLTTAAEECVQETLLQGRHGILVSYPDIDTTGMSQQEVEDKGIHAYSALYKTEDIINWRLEKVNGNLVPTLVVLQEEVDAPWNTRFITDKTTQYRVLELDEEGLYRQSIYLIEIPASSGSGLVMDELAQAYPSKVYYPMMNGEELDFIPFYPVTPRGISWDIERSPMEGITSLNIAHYRNSALYETAITLTASPTTVLRGYESDTNSKLVLGGNNVILLQTEGGAEYLEFTGQGLKGIEDAMDTKKKEMAVLGLRILSSEKSVNEGVETATINQIGEQSVLANITNSVSDAFTKALKLMVQWDNPDADVSDVKVELNTDFQPNRLNANTLNSLTVLWKSFGLSDEEFFEILKKGEVLPSDMTFEEHQEQLEDSVLFKATQVVDGGSDPARGQDFSAPVDFRRLTKPEDVGNPQASKNPNVDPGGSNNGEESTN